MITYTSANDALTMTMAAALPLTAERAVVLASASTTPSSLPTTSTSDAVETSLERHDLEYHPTLTQQQNSQQVQFQIQQQRQRHSQFQLACLYTKHKTQKRKIWHDGRLVLPCNVGGMAILHEANPPPGSADPPLDSCELNAAQVQQCRVQQQQQHHSHVAIEMEKHLVSVEGPWIERPETTASIARNHNSMGMKKLLQTKFRKPVAYVPPPRESQSSSMSALALQRRRPLQPGELQQRYYGTTSAFAGQAAMPFNHRDHSAFQSSALQQQQHHSWQGTSMAQVGRNAEQQTTTWSMQPSFLGANDPQRTAPMAHNIQHDWDHPCTADQQTGTAPILPSSSAMAAPADAPWHLTRNGGNTITSPGHYHQDPTHQPLRNHNHHNINKHRTSVPSYRATTGIGHSGKRSNHQNALTLDSSSGFDPSHFYGEDDQGQSDHENEQGELDLDPEQQQNDALCGKNKTAALSNCRHSQHATITERYPPPVVNSEVVEQNHTRWDKYQNHPQHERPAPKRIRVVHFENDNDSDEYNTNLVHRNEGDDNGDDNDGAMKNHSSSTTCNLDQQVDRTLSSPSNCRHKVTVPLVSENAKDIGTNDNDGHISSNNSNGNHGISSDGPVNNTNTLSTQQLLNLFGVAGGVTQLSLQEPTVDPSSCLRQDLPVDSLFHVTTNTTDLNASLVDEFVLPLSHHDDDNEDSSSSDEG